MKRVMVLTVAGLLTALPAWAGDDVEALRHALEQMKREYEARIAALEARLKAAEEGAASGAAEQRLAARGAEERSISGKVSSAAAPATGSATPASNAFNPQISLILDGVYFRDNKRGASIERYEQIDGINHTHGHEGHDHGKLDRGFNLRDTELRFSATVSPHFDAAAMVTISSEGNVELEEAYFDTRSLPYGLKIRAGKFLSGIGYLNSQHPHQWDFVDQNLAYRTLLGAHGLLDTGIRLSWLPKTGSWYSQLAVELLQGNDQTFATSGLATPTGRADGQPLAATTQGAFSAKKAGPRLTLFYAKFGPDLGNDHALQFGGWYAYARQHQEVHDHTLENPASFVHGLEGKGRAWGLDAVYKYDAGRYGGQGNLKLVAEYLHLNKDLTLVFHERGGLVGQGRDFTQDGLVVQGTYTFLPHWQVGLRYDATGLTKNEVKGPTGTLRKWGQSDRWTVALTRQIDHFSLLRLQLSRAHLWVGGAKESANQFFVQYQHSLGAHGAHGF